jgi:UDP-N-acetyl-D-mannosaminuronic acid transferase (WecB/TagA/CpsF family)
MMKMSGMTREEAKRYWEVFLIEIEELKQTYRDIDWEEQEQATKIAIADMEKQIQWQKTERFNRMIEAFECDFALIEQGKMTFAELDRLLKDKSYSLVTDMDLMKELSYLLRHGKAEIYVRGEEND